MIRKKYNKIISVLIATLLVGSTFIGCTSKLANADASATSTSVEQTKDTTILGRVKAIDGSNVTISLGEEVTSDNSSSVGNSQTSPQGETANGGEAPSQGGGAPDGGQPPAQGSGTSDGTQGTPPSGGQPPQGGGGPGIGNSSTTSFKLSGEEKIINISNEGIISVTKGSKTVSGTLADITIGEILSISYDSSGNISGITVKSNNTTYTGGSQTGSIALTGAYSVNGETKTSKDEKITTATANQNAILVNNGGTLTISGATITKSGDTTSEDESNFYGVNGGVVAAGASNITISDSSINTDSEGSNGIFSTGDASVINVSNVTINTTKNSSRGLDATYNGTIIAKDVNITTKGDHCAALATDRGEGTIHVTGGTMNTAGEGSPAIYSTGNITVKGATLKATGSEAACIEGKNSITLYDCNITGEKTNGVMLYQSMSGDSGVGTSYFNMSGGTLSSSAGALFFITNTDAQINLHGAKLKNSTGILLNAAATSRWGNQGTNGGNVTLNADSQTLEGTIACDNISTVILNLINNSSLTSTINGDNKAKSVILSLDKNSTWTVTGASYITALTDEDTSLANIKDNGNTIYYDSSNSANSWLNGKTITLSGGGQLVPITQ
ncbi:MULTISPECIES: hypothetical protein [unclassified Clostridium]|uniref:hypothetical protein n=1 Tax=unclassified Clostridium TaxID=2614128 RepID=UPI0002981A6D|nr:MULTISPECIES: hypothetical protein [unclassified Clostridium]EKQ56735.1 MAG: hypothetical protein A370_01510 [Clostridium sp. Maddingley MBC34-26]